MPAEVIASVEEMSMGYQPNLDEEYMSEETEDEDFTPYEKDDDISLD